MVRCATTSGPYRCDKEAGHKDERGIPTECETSEESVRTRGGEPARDVAVQRELAKAAARIQELEKGLEEIRGTPCDAVGGAAPCPCCCFDRMVASAALNGVT